MKTKVPEDSVQGMATWPEESGLLSFLASINSEVTKFNDAFEFGITIMDTVPGDIDGDASLPAQAGFILERNNLLVPEITYCLYSLLHGKELTGHIGMVRDTSLTTLKELQPISDFSKGKPVLYDWMTQLVRASCEKIML